MAYERELMERALRRWGQREIPKRGETPDARPAVRALDGEDVHVFDNQALFYDQSDQLIPGIDNPGTSASFRWTANSGYGALF